jgi:drug/metabolite transporter (DMT)-like permease
VKRSLLSLHAAVFLWGFTGVLGRAITLDAPVLVWWRVALTALIIAFFLTIRKQWIPIAKGDRVRITAVGGLMALHWVAFYGSIKASNASVALICLSTASVFTALLSPLAGQGKLNRTEVFLGLLALAGVYLIYRSQLHFGLGILLGVIAAILSAVFTVLNKPLAERYPARPVVFWEMTTGCILLTVLLIPLRGVLHLEHFWPQQAPVEQLSIGIKYLVLPNDWTWLIILSLCCTVWAQSLALAALKGLSSFTVTLSVNLEPLYGMALAFLFFHENHELTSGFWGGVAFIALSVVLQMARLLAPNWKERWIKWRGGID